MERLTKEASFLKQLLFYLLVILFFGSTLVSNFLQFKEYLHKFYTINY